MYKRNNTVLDKTGDDEPIFALVARDETAPLAVLAWIENAFRGGVDRHKIADAARSLAAMLEYQAEHGVRTPD